MCCTGTVLIVSQESSEQSTTIMAPATFNNLPVELRLEIFELALGADWKPRTIEVFIKSGEIYSKTPPPPLLHVNSESRHATLKFYKPWIPAYRDQGTSPKKPWADPENDWQSALTYTPWEEMVEEHGLENASRLQNVCIDMEYDTLLMTGEEFPYPLGPLDEDRLLSVAFKSSTDAADNRHDGDRFPFSDIIGVPLKINSLKHVEQLRRLRNLVQLTIYDRGSLDIVYALFEHRLRGWEAPIPDSEEELDQRVLSIHHLPMEKIPTSAPIVGPWTTYKI